MSKLFNITTQVWRVALAVAGVACALTSGPAQALPCSGGSCEQTFSFSLGPSAVPAAPGVAGGAPSAVKKEFDDTGIFDDLNTLIANGDAPAGATITGVKWTVSGSIFGSSGVVVTYTAPEGSRGDAQFRLDASVDKDASGASPLDGSPSTTAMPIIFSSVGNVDTGFCVVAAGDTSCNIPLGLTGLTVDGSFDASNFAIFQALGPFSAGAAVLASFPTLSGEFTGTFSTAGNFSFGGNLVLTYTYADAEKF